MPEQKGSYPREPEAAPIASVPCCPMDGDPHHIMCPDRQAARVTEMWAQAKKAKPAHMGERQWRTFRWAVCEHIAKEVGTTPEHVLYLIRHPEVPRG